MRTLIINQLYLKNVGGIEKYIFNLSRYLISQNDRVIWLCDKKPQVADSFKEVMLGEGVERYEVKTHGLRWFSIPKIDLGKDENVVIISFEPIAMARAELFCHRYKNHKIYSLYLVPDTNGNQYYLEGNFKGILHKITSSKIKKIIKRWSDEDAIRFFAKTQIKPLETAYDIRILSGDEKLLKTIVEPLPFYENQVKDKAKNRDHFIIITVGRFDFPHKGYMLGLVRAYGRLKKKFPGLELRIIGFGKDESILIDEINKLDNSVKKDIHLLGEVSPDCIPDYMKDAHLNISVAGAVADGARNGVVSIPARNYCTGECEVYGFLPDSRMFTTSLEKGNLVDSYIEKIITMSEEDYFNICKASYDTYYTKDVEPMYIFRTIENQKPLSVSLDEVRFFKTVAFLKKVKEKIGSVKNEDK